MGRNYLHMSQTYFNHQKISGIDLLMWVYLSVYYTLQPLKLMNFSLPVVVNYLSLVNKDVLTASVEQW